MGLIPILGCESKIEQQVIEQSYLRNNLKINQTIRMGDLIKAIDGTVCVLYPYQQDVDERAPESARVNTYLKASGYVADESHWAFVVIEPEAISLSIFKRSDKMDILAMHEIQAEHKAKLPKGFEPTNCAPIGRATITKIESQGRVFLIMGEMK